MNSCFFQNTYENSSVDSNMIHCMNSPNKAIAKYFAQGLLFPFCINKLTAKDISGLPKEHNSRHTAIVKRNFCTTRTWARVSGLMTSSIALALGITAAVKGILAIKALWTTLAVVSVAGLSIPFVNVIICVVLALACLLPLLYAFVTSREAIIQLNDAVKETGKKYITKQAHELGQSENEDTERAQARITALRELVISPEAGAKLLAMRRMVSSPSLDDLNNYKQLESSDD